MTLYEHELKNAYIGEVYEYSYDFRNKTLAQIQADGWNETKYNSNCWLSYWSSWFSVSKINSSTTTWAWWLYFQLPSTISSTDKITMQFTWVWWSWDTRWRLFVSLTDVPTISLASSTQIETDLSTCIWSASLPQWITCQKSVSWTQTWNVYELIRNVAWTSWFASAKCVLDLPNNKVSWEVTSPSSLAYSMEWTITTAWKNCIIWAKYFIVWWATFTVWINHQMQTASIIIE